MGKRVRNAVPTCYNGMHFDSRLEAMVYKTLVDAGFDPKYEGERYVLMKSSEITVPFLTRNKFKRKHCGIVPVGCFACIDKRPVKDVVYTPDFVFDYDNRHVIVEVKGFATDVYAYRFKLFRLMLEQRPDKDRIIVWEIHTKAQLLECIEHLKNYEKETL